MELGGITIALRKRLPWEATDLGIALVRAHAKPIFAAWCIVTLPVWLAFNGIGLAIDTPWVALLAMWWLKPVFDRVPLFVISRAVFGQTPGVRQVVRAQFTWGWRAIWPWLLWRRFHPGRVWLLPVDLLEQPSGSRRSERTRVLAKGEAGPRNQLAALGAEFELVLAIAIIMTAMLFVPTEFLPDALRDVFERLSDEPPLWAQVAFNGVIWAGTTLVEPFVIGAGFGLYLNRRVELEAWDVEHAFRRIAARLTRSVQVLCVLLMLAAFSAHPARATAVTACTDAQATAMTEIAAEPSKAAAEKLGCPVPTEDIATSLPQLFGSDYRRDGDVFFRHVKKAHAALVSTVQDSTWVARNAGKPPKADTSTGGVAQWIADTLNLIARYGLWIIAALVLAFVLYHHRVWMSWIRDLPSPEQVNRIDTHALDTPAPLPDDLPSAVRALWQAGEQRAALALLYKAAVQRLVDALGTPLPPGATEGDCLARTRQLNDRSYARLFVRIVGCWQAGAYARRMPETDVIEALLADWVGPAKAST